MLHDTSERQTLGENTKERRGIHIVDDLIEISCINHIVLTACIVDFLPRESQMFGTVYHCLLITLHLQLLRVVLTVLILLRPLNATLIKFLVIL